MLNRANVQLNRSGSLGLQPLMSVPTRLSFSSLTAPRLPYLGLGSEEALLTLADALPDAVFTIDRKSVV